MVPTISSNAASPLFKNGMRPNLAVRIGTFQRGE
jgi:hypothetical protein